MKRIAVTGLIAFSLLLAACSASDNSSSSGQGAPAAAPQQANGGSGDATDSLKEAPPAPGTYSSTQDGGKATGQTEGRSLIYRADMSIRVDNVEAASGKVAAIATTLKGNISSEKRSTGTDSSFASITIRVPSENYQSAMDRLSKEIGREESRSSNTEDVTEAVVDLDTRIAAQKSSVEAVKRVYGEAKGMTEVLQIDKELQQRLADLASLEAKKRRLDDLVSLSTITVNLAGPNTQLPGKPKDRTPGFLGGLERGWDSFLTFGNGTLFVLAFLAPYLLIIAIVLFGLRWWIRRRRKAAS